ncbi:response regulator transcription factor [Kribbella sancticallisti]|uniref:Response regulator transcription factor n=1 Tax=Kribbella sancticallisti TaxID=460087 RepID=A0ABN2CV31_9ACTN
MVIRVLLGHRGKMLRGALAAVLSKESDLRVVAEVDDADQLLTAVALERPDVLVLESRMPAEVGVEQVCRQRPGVLVLVDRQESVATSVALVRLAPRVGLIATDASPDELVVAVREIAHGRPVLDLELAMAALRAEQNPLTDREREVLRLVATGATAQEIAHKLCLSAGTVRNYLSHILAKTESRSRIEAIRKAEEAGWI